MTTEQLKKIALMALENAYRVHEELGPAGEELMQKNQFGDTALRADIAAEDAVIDTLRAAGVPIRIVSEEHGIVDLADNPLYLGILDGLDGSSVYKKARGEGRYGTMFGIFKGTDPTYADYLFSGIMEHSTKRLFYAVKGKGTHLITDGEPQHIHCSANTQLDTDTKIYIDTFFETNRTVFSPYLEGFNATYLGSSAVYYADLASGAADLVLECTRKGNLEIAIAFGLETESGGVMVTLDGQSLADRKYFAFGQDTQVPVVSSATMPLAQELLKRIKTQ